MLSIFLLFAILTTSIVPVGTADGTWTNAWNYQNRLTQSQKTGTTVTYQYDHEGQRTTYSNGTKTYRYANKLFNTDGTTPTKHIFAGDAVVATIEGATLNYVHADHLTGSNAVTNSSAGMVQLLDYYPYGGLRIDWKHGSFDEQRKFAGHERDRDTGLDYMNARYYNSGIGRFLSQDPAFLLIGDSEQFKDRYKRTLKIHLSDPQLANSYSYVANNPLKYTDSQGEFIDTLADLAFIGYDVYKIGQAWFQGESMKSEFANLGLDLSGALIPGVTGLGMANRVAQGAGKSVDKVGDVSKMLDKVGDAIKWPSPNEGKRVINGIEYSKHASTHPI